MHHLDGCSDRQVVLFVYLCRKNVLDFWIDI